MDCETIGIRWCVRGAQLEMDYDTYYSTVRYMVFVSTYAFSGIAANVSLPELFVAFDCTSLVGSCLGTAAAASHKGLKI